MGQVYNIEDVQILYDFKIFFSECIITANFNNVLKQFANYMDNIYYKNSYKYNKLLKKIIMKNFYLIFSNNFDDLVLNELINNNHIDNIKLFVNNYNSGLNKDYKNKYDIALYDFKICFDNHNLVVLDDIYNFASYMQGFYPKIPYFDVAEMLSLMVDDRDFLVNNEVYSNFFESKISGLKNIKCGRFMEIINFSRIDNSFACHNKICTKKPQKLIHQ